MFLTMVQIAMIIMKVTGNLDASWLMVFIPFYLMILVCAVDELFFRS